MTQSRVHSPRRVVAVRYGEWATTRSEVFHDGVEVGAPAAPFVLAYYFWIVETPDRTVVVDTGFDPAVADLRGRTTLVAFADALDALGIGADDNVDLVLTHAHYDHIGSTEHLRRARVWIGAPERSFWRSSAAAEFAALVEPAELDALDRIDADGRLVPVTGRVEIAPGIELLPASGHTPGQLMVRAETDHGTVLLTSDAVHFDEELAHDRPFRHMCDLAGARDVYREIRAMATGGDVDHVVAGHEDEVSRRYGPLVDVLDGLAVVVGTPPEARNRIHPREEAAL